MGNSHLGVVANYRSISCREALTFETTKGEFGLPWVKYRSIPERLGRPLHGIYDIYEAFGGGMGEMIDRVRKREASATPSGNVHLSSRALPLREKTSDRSPGDEY